MDNPHTYKDSKHNEVKDSKFEGPVGFGSKTCSVLRRGNTLADTYRLCSGNTTIYYTQAREALQMFGRLEEAPI